MPKTTKNTIYYITNNKPNIHSFDVTVKARTQEEYEKEMPSILAIVTKEINALFDKYPDLDILKIVQGEDVRMQSEDFYKYFPNFNSYKNI